MTDNVNHPPHYMQGDAKCCKCGNPIECIDVTRHQSFGIGNAIKYLWRYKNKNGIEDLRKAIWYIQDEINQYEKDTKVNNENVHRGLKIENGKVKELK